MKILWFTNTPSIAAEHLQLKIVGGGWIKSLEGEISSKIDLSIAFYYNKKLYPFTIGDTHYYPILKKRNFTNRMLDNIFNRLEPIDDVNIFMDIINNVRPDLIHIHGTENNFGYILDKCTIPIVISLQGIISVIYYKYFIGIPIKFAKQKNGLRDFILRKSYYKKYKKYLKMKGREEGVLKKARYIIGRTEFDRNVSRVLSPKTKYFHLDEILRDGFYKSVWQKKREKLFVIHSTMNTQLYKGLEIIAEVNTLLQKHNINFIWQIAGIKSTDHIIQIVSNKVKNTKWLKSTNFLDILEESTLIQYMLDADVFVLTSHIENSPNSLCEAMLLGLPVVSPLIGGVNSLVTNKYDGMLVQDADPWSIAGAILEIYDNISMATRLGEKARENALLRHDKEKISAELLKIYNSIISEA